MRPIRIFILALSMSIGTVAEGIELPSRLSMAVSVVSAKNNALFSIVQKPSRGFVEAYTMLPTDFPDDTVIVLDHEWMDGVKNPYHISGGDWMALVGVQRTGTVMVAAGTPLTRAGIPSQSRNWQFFNLGTKLLPNVWYRLRIDADFGARRFISFEIEGPGVNKKLDLSSYDLDFPNYMPFDGRAMTYYVGVMRSQGWITKPGGTPIAIFDDVRGQMNISANQSTPLYVPLLQNGFENQLSVGPQPITAIPVPLAGYQNSIWYLERSESLFTVAKVPYARSGQSVGVANATLLSP